MSGVADQRGSGSAMGRLRLGETPGANPAVLGLCPYRRAQNRKLKEANAARSRARKILAGPSAQASSDTSRERMGFSEQAHGDAFAPLERSAPLAAPRRRKDGSRKAGVACIPPYLLDAAQRVRNRCKGATGATPACGHSHDDEHLHESGARASAGGEQQGRSASAAYRNVNAVFCVPLCSLMRIQVAQKQQDMAEACGSRTHHSTREGPNRRL